MIPIPITNIKMVEKYKSGQKSKDGFTIIELIIYTTIAVLVIGILLGIYFFMRRALWKSQSAFDVQRDIQIAVERIRNDLTETGLNSITVYPGSGNKGSGVSMITAQEEEKSGTDTTRHFRISKYGTPMWTGHIFYAVIPKPVEQQEVKSPYQRKIGTLIRWENTFNKSTNPPYPFPTTVLPSEFSSKGKPVRVIIKGIQLPDAPELQGMEHLKIGNKNFGGFRVAFVRQVRNSYGKVTSESLSEINPARVDDGTPGDSTSQISNLVQVNLDVVHLSIQIGKLSAISLSFRVCPRH